MAEAEDVSGSSAWTVEGRRSRYTIGYWMGFLVATFGQTLPPAPEIVYTIRNASTGERRKIKLPGDHSPADLAAALAAQSAA